MTIMCAAIAVAQSPPYEGRKIVAIEYVPSQVLDPADLATVQPLKVGATLRAADVSEAIDSLFSTGRFQDIEVEAQPSGDGVIVRFVTTLTYFLSGINVEGKAVQSPNRGQIASTGQFTIGTPFSDADLTQALDNIDRMMKSNGLYEANVTPKVEREEKGQQIFLTLTVKEGKRAKYEQPVIQGDTKLSDSTILRATGWRVPLIHWWRQVTEARTRQGIQGLLGKYQSQDRLTAHVEVTSLDYDAKHRRVRPTLVLNAGPKVQVKAVEAKVSQRVMKRYVPVFQERDVYDDLLVEGKRNLRDYFQSQGYYDVDVTYRVQPVKDDTQVIEYVISQGQRYKLIKVNIAGNKYFTTDVIRERMFITPATFNLRRGRYSEAFRRKDEENISNLYRSNGFRDVRIVPAVDRDYMGKNGQVAVTLTIAEGPQWLVDKLTVTGVQQLGTSALLSKLGSSAGQPFSEATLAADREAILTYYYSEGFPEADFKAEWRNGSAPNRPEVIYTITEGARKTVRDVLISGLRTTRPGLVQRSLTLKAGDPLSPIVQTEIQKRFYDLGVFARVDTAIQNPNGDSDHKYVLYNFQEANRYTLSLGVGADIARFGTPSTTNLSAAAGATGFSPLISADITRLNFLGRGHTVSLRGMYSSIEKRASLIYLQPRFQNVDGRNLSYTLLFDNTLNVRTFASKREELSAQLTQQFSKSLTGIIRMAYRRVSVSNVVIPVLLVPQLLQPLRIGILSANFAQDRRDNSGDPHRGIYNTADIGIASKFLGSQRSFGRMLLRNATYYQVRKNLILARQTEFGVIAPFSAPAGVSAEQSVPLPERFFGGGADSLRAFPYNQAGPRDIGAALVAGGPTSQPTGFPLGGNALFFNNVELRFPFIGENIQGVFFHDMGNVFSSLSRITFRFRQNNLQDFNYTVHAVGFGLRYKTLIGPIRGDLAYSVNPPSFNGFSGTAQQLLQCNPNTPVSSLPGYCTPARQGVSHFQFFISIGQAF